jgi:hypothetical protein
LKEKALFSSAPIVQKTVHVRQMLGNCWGGNAGTSFDTVVYEKLYRVFKFILLGEALVGKTSICHRWAHGIFQNTYPRTDSDIDFTTKEIYIGGEDPIKIQLWDTAGLERYNIALPRVHYRNAHCAVCVYDITSKETLKKYKDGKKNCELTAFRISSLQ